MARSERARVCAQPGVVGTAEFRTAGALRSAPTLYQVLGEVDARKFRTGKADAGGGYDVDHVDREGDGFSANRRDIFDDQAIGQQLRPVVAIPEMAK